MSQNWGCAAFPRLKTILIKINNGFQKTQGEIYGVTAQTAEITEEGFNRGILWALTDWQLLKYLADHDTFREIF